MHYAWGILLVAIAFEISGTILLKLSDGFSKVGFGIASILCYWVCFGALAWVLKYIPVGVAYAIWSGIGIVGASVAGYFLFKENLTVVQYACILLILLGAIGLNATTKPA